MEQTESGEYIVNLESSDENIDSEIMENNNIGGQELAILLGFLFIIYGVLDFLISNLGSLFQVVLYRQLFLDY